MIFFRSPYEDGEMRVLNSVTLVKQKLAPEKFTIEYPFISNDKNDKILSKINTNIIDEVSKLFKNQVLLPEQVDFEEVLGTYEVKVNKNDILSILFIMYNYVNKAAHGVTDYLSLTVNTKTGQVYSFNDLFNPKINYVPIVNEIAKQYIKDNNIQLINEYNGITPNQQYYLTENKLVLYYQPYEYTPGYYGIFEIGIPYSKIKNLITPLSHISKLMV